MKRSLTGNGAAAVPYECTQKADKSSDSATTRHKETKFVSSSKSARSGLQRNQSLGSPAPMQDTCPTTLSIPNAPGVEDYSLTYLGYKQFFTETPLSRSLDRVSEDLSQTPLQDIFENAIKKVASEPTIVSVDRSVHGSAGQASTTGPTHDEHVSGRPVSSVKTPNGCATKLRKEILAAGNTMAAAHPSSHQAGGTAWYPVDVSETDVQSTAHHDGAVAAEDIQPTTPKEDRPRPEERDARQVQEFWDNVRSHLWISDDELHDQPTAFPPAAHTQRFVQSSSGPSPTSRGSQSQRSGSAAARRSSALPQTSKPAHPLEATMAELDRFFDEEDDAELQFQPGYSNSGPWDNGREGRDL